MVSGRVPEDAAQLRSRWRRASRCSASQCVEVCFADRVLVRDSKQNGASGQPVIAIDHDAWALFLEEIQDRAPSGANGMIEHREAGDGGAVLRSIIDGTELVFDRAEFAAFVDGVKAGEFSPSLLA